MTTDPNTVTISKKEYDDLVRSSRMLQALENSGVDNWEWYSEALREFFGEDDEDY